MIDNKKNKRMTTITVPRDEFEEELRREFNNLAFAYEIPRGELLSRALYLACKEVIGDIEMKKSLHVMKLSAQREGKSFHKDVVLDSEKWKKRIPFFRGISTP